MKKISSLFLIAVILLTGCATQGVSEVNPEATGYLMRSESGIIESIKPVVIKDTGTGSFLGAITGAVLGSTIGRGRGNTLATLGGGLLGAYAGNQVGKANAQELDVDLDSGSHVVVIAKGDKFSVGQHVKIVLRGDRVVSVEHD